MQDYQPGQKITPTGASAYIAPNGAFHFVPDCSHWLVAPLLSTNTIDPDGDLQSRGWIHFSYTGVHTMREITQSQRDTLFDVAMAFEAGQFINPQAASHQREYKRHLARALGMELSTDAKPFIDDTPVVAAPPPPPPPAPNRPVRRKRVTQRNAQEMLTLVRKTYRWADQRELVLKRDWDWVGGANWTIVWEGGPADWALAMGDILYRKVGDTGAFWTEPYSSWALCLWPR